MLGIKSKIKLFTFQRKWRKKNRHNQTDAMNIFDLNCVSVGKNTYGLLNVYCDSNLNKLTIGNYCSIAREVMFILNSDHELKNISTYPFKVKLLKCTNQEAISKGNIIIDDDVWIGFRAIVLSGVHIHQGAVVAAGSVVTKDVPPYAIVGGNPARIIKYRFKRELIDQLIKINYENISIDIIEKYLHYFYKDISKYSSKEIEELINKINTNYK